MERQQAFGLILDALVIAFAQTCSVDDYMNIVKHIRLYAIDRIDKNEELIELTRVGYPSTYDPCRVDNRIRFCMIFGGDDNKDLQPILTLLDLHQKQYILPSKL